MSKGILNLPISLLVDTNVCKNVIIFFDLVNLCWAKIPFRIFDKVASVKLLSMKYTDLITFYGHKSRFVLLRKSYITLAMSSLIFCSIKTRELFWINAKPGSGITKNLLQLAKYYYIEAFSAASFSSSESLVTIFLALS